MGSEMVEQSYRYMVMEDRGARCRDLRFKLESNSLWWILWWEHPAQYSGEQAMLSGGVEADLLLGWLPNSPPQLLRRVHPSQS